MKPIVIDIHAHFTPKFLFERFDAHAAKFPGVKLIRDEKGPRIQFPGTEPTRPVMPRLSDLTDRRTWMDKNGIDHQLVGGWLDIFGYELPANEGREYYWSDLIGLRVTNLQGVPLGQVTKLLETAAQQVLLIEGERERLIPFIESVVVSVDVAGGSLVVDWDADF